MANICNSVYRIKGSDSELDALYSLMLKLSQEKEHGNWVGHIVKALNGDELPEYFYVRGWWSNLKREDGFISFDQESAWEPIYEAWDFICSKFETLIAYFQGEEPGCEVFLKRDDDEHHWFPDNYMLDACPSNGECHIEYFQTIDDAFRYIEKLDDVNIITADDVEALNLKWNEEDEDAYIHLHEFTEV